MITKREIMSLSHYYNGILIRVHKHLRENMKEGISHGIESKSLANLIESIETEYGVPKWKVLNEDYKVENERVLRAYEILRKECIFLGYNPSEQNSSDGEDRHTIN